MKPSFSVLKQNYPLKKEVDRAVLFKEIGWHDLIDNPNFTNTCAIRVSVALLRSGVPIPGQIPIKAGPLKGKMIETMQWKLSRALVKILGKPEKFNTERTAERGIGERTGIASFFVLHPGINDTSGHIDIVFPGNGYTECGTGCYWSSKEVWFWPLR